MDKASTLDSMFSTVKRPLFSPSGHKPSFQDTKGCNYNFNPKHSVKMKNALLLIVLLFSLQLLTAQSYLTDNNTSSFVLGAGATSHNYLSSYSGYIGYSHKGTVDFGVSLKKGQMSQMDNFYNIEEKSISPFVNVTLVKARKYGAPFSLAVSAEYDAFSMESNYSLNPMSGSNKVIELGARIYFYINLIDGFAFHPAFRISYSNDEMLVYNSDPSAKNDSNNKSLASSTLVNYAKAEFFLPVTFSYNGMDRVAFSPSVGFSAVGPEVNVTLGYIIGSAAKGKCGKNGCPIFGKRG